MKYYFDKMYKDSAEKFYSLIKDNLNNNKKTFIVTANPETFSYGKEEDFNELLLDDNTTIVPDGIGIVKASRMLGYDVKERIPGVDIAVKLLEYSNELKKKVYLFGAKQEIIDKMKEVIDSKYPDAELGIPNQEKLIYKHLKEFKKGIFIGVGGSFDVISGSKKRAPKLFVKLNIEWLYRICKEPSRLKRFWNNNVKFIFKIQKMKKKVK